MSWRVICLISSARLQQRAENYEISSVLSVYLAMQQVLNIHNHTVLLSHLLNSGFYPSLDYGPYRQLYITNATKPWQSSAQEDDSLVACITRTWCTTSHLCLSSLRWQSILFNTSWKNLMHNRSFYSHFIEKTRRHLQTATGTDYIPF